MKTKHKRTQEQAAAKAGMNVKTARKYLQNPMTSTQKAPPRKYRTRKDPFAAHRDILEAFLHNAPELQAHTLLAHLITQAPNLYSPNHLRSLQRWVQHWKRNQGPDKSIIFRQLLTPGRQSQSDWTCMNDLGIEIAGKPFPHLLFHFMLPYSTWEHITVGYSESLAELTQGYENAVWQLGGVLPEHRTDNLSAATQRFGCSRKFTENWTEFLAHYGVSPSRNNPGESHENGSVEKSHDLLYTTIDQYLMIRGSRNFSSLNEYQSWLFSIVKKRNTGRQIRLQEELALLRPLPEKPYHAPTVLPIRVNTQAVVMILGIPYSVPSRLILSTLKAYVYAENIELYYGEKCIQRMPRSYNLPQINYRHIIDSLIRKPGAFAQYQYRDCLFPKPLFKQAYDYLALSCPEHAIKHYLKLLQLAKLYGEQEVLIALQLLNEDKQIPLPDAVKLLLDAGHMRITDVKVDKPSLAAYDSLHAFRGQEVTV